MPSDIVVYKSSTAYYIAFFAIAIIWVFIGTEQSYLTLSSLLITPFDWLFISSTIMISMIIPVVLLSYNFKKQVIFTEPSWEYRIRDVEITEFDKMMLEYKKSYTSLMSQIDYKIFILVVLTSTTGIFFPLPIPFSVSLLIWGPYIFSGLILVTIFLLAMFVFRATPNSATPHFSLYPEKTLRKLVNILWDTKGILWAGINMKIGEAEGYFIIQEVKAIGRIEGIESVGSIEISLEEEGEYSATSKLYLDPDLGTEIIDLKFKSIESIDVTSLVRKTVIAYVDAKGTNEMLEDVMLDLTIPIDEMETDVLMSENNDSTDESRVVDDQ
jgi:hypothetical protein